MKVSMQEICKFAKTQPSCKSFIGGEGLLNARHVIHCGTVSDSKNTGGNNFNIAFCLQTSNLRDTPHEITGEISNEGEIFKMQCSCKAGLSVACKHVVAVLLYCNRNDLEDLKSTTCTDKKCIWNVPQKSSLEKYEAQPLQMHKCLFPDNEIEDEEEATNEEKELELDEKLLKIMIRGLPNSALALHISGRHEPLESNNNNVSIIESEKLQAIFKNQASSSVLNYLMNYETNPLRDCCKQFASRLEKDVQKICLDTAEYHSVWLEERQFRLTGSNSYSLFTYRKNKKADWEKKYLAYFYPKQINNCYVQHGLKNEPLAREAYEKSNSTNVTQCGLVVSNNNSWLGYSPDGIVFDGDDKPIKLIEIKCPYNGRNCNSAEVIESLKWLVKDDNNQASLKKCHSYYAQIQIGMAVLNLPSTDFIIYTPFDNALLTFSVQFDEEYAKDLLSSLKKIYFNNMIHYACQNENAST